VNRCRGVSVDGIRVSVQSPQSRPVPEQSVEDGTRRPTALILSDVGDTSRFGSLKAALRTISAVTCVRPWPFASNLRSADTSLQVTITARNKVEVVLLHISSLDGLFATPPRDVAEQRCRSDLIEYVIVSSHIHC
jgi:hypothetical protein